MNTRSALGLGLWALGLTCSLPTWADDESIATDRPDFVESSDVVGKGRIQLETSLAWERDRQGGTRTRLGSTPTLLRIGVADAWELRFETDGRLRQRSTDSTGSSTTRGWSDLAVGVKWHQRDGDEAAGTPGIGWLLHADLDSGSGAFRGQGVRPSLRMVAEWEFAGGWTLGVMPGLYRDRDENGHHYTGAILAAVVGKSFTDTLRGFVELSGQQLAAARHGGRVVTLDAGVAWLLTRDLQLDTAVSRGVNAAAPDWSWTVGLSTRF
ncbi:transporter [Roseateles sp. BYS87W]|uniref:Transporter n=1 Tax=Pelomonas baiyunensis TaxID=3299026 RepID=A0ABW7GXA7_9BURK